jgi:hypothetical protein
MSCFPPRAFTAFLNAVEVRTRVLAQTWNLRFSVMFNMPHTPELRIPRLRPSPLPSSPLQSPPEEDELGGVTTFPPEFPSIFVPDGLNWIR